jgi:indole-3-glycerol phosphate synthase/phosphoribosylanthranilate isomerase
MRFAKSLSAPGFGAIAEFKRRSPSAGDISTAAQVEEIVPTYETGGARAVSVLVDDAFAGSLDDLRAARAAVGLPLLAKGFFSTPDDLRTARKAGADAALLILRDLDDATAAALMAFASQVGLDTLVEAHDAAELDRAIGLGADPIGLNARDLGTFAIDRRAQLGLVARAPRDRTVIAESAVHSRAQAAAAELAGADAVLIGTALMRSPDPEQALRDLLARPLVKVCGLTNEEDVAVAAEAGADLLGFVLAQESPRRAAAVLPVPDTTLSVAVLVGEQEDTGADLTQLYAREDGHRARDAALLRDGEPVAQVLDLPWGEKDEGHWRRAAEADGRVMLAGRLAADKVREAIERVRPWAVDASSRLEREPGIKDHDAVRAYVEAAR